MTDSNATYNTSITCDLPDYPSSNVTFRNEAYFTSGNNEVFPGLRYTLTLDANGQGTQVLPCPDNTGTAAANWRITMPSRESVTSAIAYSVTPQLLSDILAAGSTTTSPDDITAALANKVSKSGDTMTGDLTFSGAGIVAADTISANTSYTETGSEAVGAMWWNPDEETLNLKVDSAVALQLGQETFFNVTNQSGAQIDNGTPVMFSGTLGASGRLLIQLAIADGSLSPSYSMGIATENIANGANGKVTWFGKVRGIDTTGTPYGEVWNDGDILYISPTTAGYLTNVQPSAPDRAIEIAAVVHAHATVGTLFVRPTWSPKLTELDDVNGTPLTTDGQLLVWDNTAGYFDASANTSDFLAVANNLSDLNSAATARTNLDVYGTGDFSAAPVASEPLKADGSGGIELQRTGIGASPPTQGKLFVFEQPAAGTSTHKLAEFLFLPEYTTSSSLVAVNAETRALNATSLITGGNFTARNLNANTVAIARGMNVQIINSSASGAITNARALSISSASNNGTISNLYGIYAESQSGGVNNYAIYTNLGKVRLGDNLQIDVPTAATTGQIIKLAAGATANAIETQTSAAAVTFAIGPTGQIKTNQASANTNTPSGATAYQLPWYAANGTLLGYVPVYPAAW